MILLPLRVLRVSYSEDSERETPSSPEIQGLWFLGGIMKNVQTFTVMARSESERSVENDLTDHLADHADRRFVIPTLVANNHKTTRGVVA